MRSEQTPRWLDELITKESHEISKQAQGDKIKALEKKIDSAKTPEELDAIEKEINELESQAKSDVDTDGGKDDAGGNDAGGDDEAGPAKAGPTGDEGDEGGGGGDVMKELKDIKKDVTDKNDEIQQKLLNEMQKLNDQLGLNKIVDLNPTVNTM